MSSIKVEFPNGDYIFVSPQDQHLFEGKLIKRPDDSRNIIYSPVHKNNISIQRYILNPPKGFMGVQKIKDRYNFTRENLEIVDKRDAAKRQRQKYLERNPGRSKQPVYTTSDDKVIVHYSYGEDSFFIIDLEDQSKIEGFTFRKMGTPKRIEAIKEVDGVKTYRSLERLLLSTDKSSRVMQINKDLCDFTKSNLMIESKKRSQLQRGPNKTEGKSSQYKGVYQERKRKGIWRAKLVVDGIANHLGCFPTEIMAAQAYNKYAIELYGEGYVKLNEID
ncbi:hypothetical protein EHV15_34560 [Paenibacillus oralis]|uniref:AP2/ERF domain-containing protein n=1 Tax=Paenibacillus oralis TaxID=2490856 RepID=A0A3P3T9V3_9BACL|nr:hypothetical protein [Paenibacillus oralis]RRJ54722.1 hypothetical protein EHV15_34560 [Paenibacillus oralis]